MPVATAAANRLTPIGTATPWGPAESLRSRMLRPGPSGSREEVARSQRERLMAATVAVVAERGYERARVADVLQVAGVSRSAYYEYFSSKEEGFLATLDALIELAEPIVTHAYREAAGTWDDRLRAAFDRVVEIVVAQSPASRIWFVDAYSAGPEAIERVERIGDRLERAIKRVLEESPERRGMPPGIIRAIVGALRQVIHSRLRRGREGELLELAPDLVDWALGYETPPRRLRRPRRVPALPSPAPDPGQRARIIRAVTEAVAAKGYGALTIAEIAKRAAVSLSTFYALFESKDAVFLAALEDGERRLGETVAPIYRQATDWPHAIKDSTHAVFAFLATNPAVAQLGAVHAHSANQTSHSRQERSRDGYRALLRPGVEAYAETAGIAEEAIANSMLALIHQQFRKAGAQRLYEAAPTAVYVALAPFLGCERATAIANESWTAPAS